MNKARWQRAAWWLLALLALAATGMAYLQPAFMVRLSEQVWACFG